MSCRATKLLPARPLASRGHERVGVEVFRDCADTHPVPTCRFNHKLLAMIVALAVFCQAVGAYGSVVLCRHADGTEKVENLVEQIRCHSTVEDRSGSSVSANCIDQTLSTESVTSQRQSTELTRLNLAPLPVAFLSWELRGLSEPQPRRSIDAISHTIPTAEQHALRISAVVLVI